METVGAFFKAVAAFFGWKTQRDAQRNTPAMQASAQARREQRQVAAEARATAERDEEKTREQLSEG